MDGRFAAQCLGFGFRISCLGFRGVWGAPFLFQDALDVEASMELLERAGRRSAFQRSKPYTVTPKRS